MRPGAYQMQAAIACLHGAAQTYTDTDWPQIAKLYRLLENRWRTPVVRVNRAVAVAEVAGPRADSYRQALDCPCNDSDRRFLLRRLAEIEDERS